METHICAVDVLLVKDFNLLSFEQKCALKNKRPTPKLPLEHNDKPNTRKFQSSWYTKFKWLSGCDKRNKLFCFVCLFFRGDKEWCCDGISTAKYFLRKAETHAISRDHLLNEEKYRLMVGAPVEHAVSENRRLMDIKHNEQVGVNRRMLLRMIRMVCFMSERELALCGHQENYESSNYIESLELLAQQGQLLEKPLLSSPFLGRASKTVQNNLIQCITSVLNDYIFRELKSTRFISIQIDETTDVSYESQVSIILRYVIDQDLIERFVGFFYVYNNTTAFGLAELINREIMNRDIENKIVFQTYDGMSIMLGKRDGVPHIIKQTHPKVLFLHCYSHKLNLLFLHGAKTIKSVKFFICNLTMFRTFFDRSTKRTEYLIKRGFRLPNPREKQWNYHSKAVDTIRNHFHEIKGAVTHVMEEPNWDPVSVNMASGLYDKLTDSEFIFLLNLFSKIFAIIDHTFDLIQSKSMSDIDACVEAVKKLKIKLMETKKEETVNMCCYYANIFNNNMTYDDKEKTILRQVMYEILDSIIVQIEIRFDDYNKIKFVELTNEKKFYDYYQKFPEEQFKKLLRQYPRTFNKDRLRNELKLLFLDVEKHLPPRLLLNFIFKSKLQLLIHNIFLKLY